MPSTSKVNQRRISDVSLTNCSPLKRRLSLEEIRSNIWFDIQTVTVPEPNGNSTKKFRAIFKLDGMTYNDVDVDKTQAKMKALRCLLKNIFLLFRNTNEFNDTYPISCEIYRYKSGLTYVVDEIHSNWYRVQVEEKGLLYYGESSCAATGRLEVLAAMLINNYVPSGRIPDKNSSETRNLTVMLDSIHKQLLYDLKITPLLTYPSVYNIYMMIDGKLFNDRGNSEEQAKINVVKKILIEIQQYQSNIGLTSNTPMASLIYAFKENFIVQKKLSAVDDSLIIKMNDHIFKVPKSKTYAEAMLNIITKVIADVPDDLIFIERRKLIKNACKNIPIMEPIELLETLMPNIKIQNLSTDINGQFKTLIKINDMVYNGTATKIKAANEAAAKSALGTIFNISYSPMRVIDLVKQSSLKEFELSQPYADAIQSLVIQKYMEVTRGPKIDYFDLNTVLAGIVMTRSDEINSGTVLCVTTGTRTINGKHLCLKGSVVNDMHAEILAKRCLIDFFYRQLDLLKNKATAQESIFENKHNDKIMYKIKNEYSFHLYISKTPCGDASCHRSDDYETVGYLRTKVEASQGSISIQKRPSNIQTWDGIKNGEQLVTMSCCDKILKWNLLGIQGSLLATVMDPIYLKSITFGTTFPAKLMFRAVCHRLPETANIHAPYHLNTPKLACTTTLEIRNPNYARGKTPDGCLIWTNGWNSYENILYDTGKTTPNNGISRIAKRKFFEHFRNIIVPIQLKAGVTFDVTFDYGQCKQLAVDYQTVKTIFYNNLIQSNIGKWIKKPNEQDEFLL